MKPSTKIMLTMSVMAVAVTGFAVVDGVHVFPVPPSKMAEFNARTGGLVFPPKDAKQLVVLDARTTPGTSLSNCVAVAESLLSLNCDLRKATCAQGDDPGRIARAELKAGAGGAILFYEREDAPVMTVFPEEAVALVNVKPLYSPDLKTRNTRFIKEFWRAIGYALGGYGNVLQPSSIMQPVYSIAELDAIKASKLTPQQMAAVSATRAQTRIFGKGAVPYSRACREGWAPAPTNDVQKALYERFCDPSTRFTNDFQPKVEYKK